MTLHLPDIIASDTIQSCSAADEFVPAGKALKRKIARYAPRAAAFLGKAAYSAITETKLIPWGVQGDAVRWSDGVGRTAARDHRQARGSDPGRRQPAAVPRCAQDPMGVMYGGHLEHGIRAARTARIEQTKAQSLRRIVVAAVLTLTALLLPGLASPADAWTLHSAVGAPSDLKLAGSVRLRYETLDGRARPGFQRIR